MYASASTTSNTAKTSAYRLVKNNPMEKEQLDQMYDLLHKFY